MRLNCSSQFSSSLNRPRNFVTASSPSAAAALSLVPVQLPSRLETHLWYIVPDEVNSPSLLRQYSRVLSPSEKAYISTVRDHRLQKTSLLARALVRTTIARYRINNGKVDPSSFKFRKNNHGKPELDWDDGEHGSPPPIHFNISHTASLVACGVTVGSPIGIDVEDKNRRIKTDVVSFARRYFTAHEVETLSSISDPNAQHQHFIKLWTLKEAYVKALGKGFSALPFSTFNIRSRNFPHMGLNNSSDSCTEIVVESVESQSSPVNKWQFKLMELAGTHFAAICVESDQSIGGEGFTSKNFTVRKTVPFVGDELLSRSDSLFNIGL